MSVASVLLTAIGGLLLAAGTVSAWVVREVTREVGGVPLTETEAVAGTAFASSGLPLGLAAVAVSLALLAGGHVRRAAGVAAVLIGAGAVVVVAFGVARAMGEQGGLGAGVAAAASGAVAIGLGGVVAVGGAVPPRLGERYTVDGEADDDEWKLAAEGDGDHG